LLYLQLKIDFLLLSGSMRSNSNDMSTSENNEGKVIHDLDTTQAMALIEKDIFSAVSTLGNVMRDIGEYASG